MSKKKRGRFHHIRQKFPKRMQKKLVMLFIAIVLAFAGLIGKITHINATNGEKYTKIVLDQLKYNSRTIPFRRGDIIDRNGTVIATSERVYNVVLDSYVMLYQKEGEERENAVREVKEVLGECFDIEASVIDEIVSERPDSRYNVLIKKVSYADAQEYKALIAETYKDKNNKDQYKYPNSRSSIWLEEDYIRAYPYSTLAADVIGFTVAGNVGNGGIEATYNDVLNGTDGREYGYLDTDSSLERTVKEAMDGKTVVSTIDIALQSIVEKHIVAFNEAHKNEAREGEGSKNTAVIVMNPNTGEILAEASYPNYDLNNPRDLTKYYSEESIDAMSSEEKLEKLNQLWRNFCVSDSYEPGSVAKTFTIATGLENGTLSGGETYNCTGSMRVGGWTISCHKTEGHGIQTLSDGIANSCNVVMMRVVAAIGVDEFCKYQSVFSFGQETGIDLPGEAVGLLYDQERMDSASLASNSFGQNFNNTMTQMVAGFASLINGGNYYEPHIVKQIQDQNGNVVENKDPVLLKRTVSAETSELMKQYMKQTMITGTGKTAKVEGYSIGAKTGTAEKHPRDHKSYLLSFMGFAPAENPEVLIYVVIDEPNVAKQDTSKYVLDLSREIMAEIFPYLGIPMVEGYVPPEPVEDTLTSEDSADVSEDNTEAPTDSVEIQEGNAGVTE